MKISIIDWKLLGTCNLRCLHCYGPPKSERELPFDDLIKIINKFPKLGVEWVVLTGGEPLLVKNIERVMEHIKSLGIKIGLSTNTTYFRQFQKVIETYVDSLNIPFDGSTPEIHARSRADKNSYFTFLDILYHYAQNTKNKPKLLRIGSVFSRATQGDFMEMARRLEPFEHIIDKWKIYEILDYEFQPKLRQPIMHEQGTFEIEMKNLLRKTKLAPKIILATSKIRNRAYFMINPRGEVVIPSSFKGVTREIPIANILTDDLEEIKQNWLLHVETKNYIQTHTHYIKI